MATSSSSVPLFQLRPHFLPTQAPLPAPKSLPVYAPLPAPRVFSPPFVPVPPLLDWASREKILSTVEARKIVKGEKGVRRPNPYILRAMPSFLWPNELEYIDQLHKAFTGKKEKRSAAKKSRPKAMSVPSVSRKPAAVRAKPSITPSVPKKAPSCIDQKHSLYDVQPVAPVRFLQRNARPMNVLTLDMNENFPPMKEQLLTPTGRPLRRCSKPAFYQ